MPLAFFLFVGCCTLRAETKYDLDWKPVLGQTVDYQISAHGTSDDVSHERSAKLHIVVRGATETHGYALLCDLTARTDKPQNGEAEASPDVTGAWLESNTEEDQDVEKLDDFGATASLLVVGYTEKDVKEGDTWTMGSDGEIQHYKFEGTELAAGVPALKVTMHSEGKEVKEDDTYWFRPSDSLLLRAEQHTVGKDKDESGKEVSYDQTTTMTMQSEARNPVRLTTEDLKLLDRVDPQLKCLTALSGAQTDTSNYDLVVHEFREVRLCVLSPKSGVQGMITTALPTGATVECMLGKDGKHIACSVVTPAPSGSD